MNPLQDPLSPSPIRDCVLAYAAAHPGPEVWR